MQHPPRPGPARAAVDACGRARACGRGRARTCAPVWNDASPCLVSDVSTHTTGQLRARQHSVWVCARLSVCVCVHACVCVLVMGGGMGEESVIGKIKRKEEGLFVSRRRLAAGSH